MKVITKVDILMPTVNDDPRISELMLNLKELSKANKIEFKFFTKKSLDWIGIIEKSANKTFIITGNIEVCRTKIIGIFEENKENKLGTNAS